MRKISCNSWRALSIAAALAMTGCATREQPELGAVAGVVTLDGAPLAGATVEFEPRRGKTSRGISDAAGRYELVYLRDQKGAIVGEQTVRITTQREQQPLEKLPPQYHTATTLQRVVKSGENEIDFALSSQNDLPAN